jgi:Ca-activated chloride channel homolog
VSFASPLVLLGLLAIPALVYWYVAQGRQRERAVAAFANPALTASFAPNQPGWRRHAPMLLFLIATAILLLAAARPQRSVVVPVKGAAIMLANDVSNSMGATDVQPSRLAAAKRASERFVAHLPGTVAVGQLEFARNPAVLQSPTTDHALTQAAIAQLHLGGGGTATGNAILAAVAALQSAPKIDGKRPPGAIVLLSDGGANGGVSVVTAAQYAKSKHIPVYTISLGTPNGTIPIKRGSVVTTTAVPVNGQDLAEIASGSGGRAYTAADSANARSIYDHLAKKLGQRHVKQPITAAFAGGGLVVLLLGGGLSLRWFGRII